MYSTTSDEKAEWVKILEEMYQKQITFNTVLKKEGNWISPTKAKESVKAFEFLGELENEVGDLSEELETLQGLGMIEKDTTYSEPVYHVFGI